MKELNLEFIECSESRRCCMNGISSLTAFVWISCFYHGHGETHLVCPSCSAESATEALSVALDSVPRVFHLALNLKCNRKGKMCAR